MVLRFNVALISEAESCEAATTNQKMVGLQPSIASLWILCKLGWRGSNPRMRESKSRALPLGDIPKGDALLVTRGANRSKEEV